MPASFVALPVAWGDAFLVSSTDFSALIDGGSSGKTLLGLLSTHRHVRALDVVACTHNDADHARGLIGLLKCQKINVREVWLPGQWTTRLVDLLVAPEAFMFEAFREIDTLGEDRRTATLSDLADRNQDANTEQSECPLIVEALDEAVEASAERPGRSLHHLVPWCPAWFYHSQGIQARLFWEAINAAERIRELAYLAWARAAKVRWFDIASAPVTTKTEPLLPVNAKEIVRVLPSRPSALQFLALSVDNRRSLCFEFQSASKNLAVLFTGDSDLKFKHPINWSKGMIVTAPHHGSEANAHAYTLASQSQHHQSILWVRSDCRFRSRPGDTFLQQIKRYCTRCRPYSHGEQAVHFTSTAAGWITRRTKPCRCV